MSMYCTCTCTLSLSLTLWKFYTSDPSTSHDPRGEKGRKGEGEEEREGGRREREGVKGRKKA